MPRKKNSHYHPTSAPVLPKPTVAGPEQLVSLVNEPFAPPPYAEPTPPSQSGKKSLSAPSLQAGHRERLRQRFAQAPHALPDYELLELLLGHVLVRKDTKPLAKTLLAALGSLRGVLDARPEELRAVEGVGPGVEAFFALLREVLARHAEGPVRTREELCTPETVAAMARKRLASCSHEEVWAAFVDNRNRLLAWEQVSKGGLSSSDLSPRVVVEMALRHKASGIMLVHNHPSGQLGPSGVDVTITEQVRKAGEFFALRMLDHIIVTDIGCYSIVLGRTLL